MAETDSYDPALGVENENCRISLAFSFCCGQVPASISRAVNPSAARPTFTVLAEWGATKNVTGIMGRRDEGTAGSALLLINVGNRVRSASSEQRLWKGKQNLPLAPTDRNSA